MLEKTGVHEVGVFGKWAKNLGIWASFHVNLSYLNISCKKSYCNSYLCLLVFHLPHYLPLLPLRLFPLLFIFCSLNMMYLKHGFVFVHCVVYFHGYLFCFVLHMYPELLRSVYVIWESPLPFLLQVFLLSYSFFLLLELKRYVWSIFWYCSTVLRCSVLFCASVSLDCGLERLYHPSLVL